MDASSVVPAAAVFPARAGIQRNAALDSRLRGNDESFVAPLRFITAGSVDDGKSTLIGRLLVDSKAVLQDQLAGVQRAGATDLALLTDGLQAEREQGITIDVAWRYFATPARKFIIGDAPGHEQYTRNMVTAASAADAVVVLVDATKLPWQAGEPPLLPQTHRHALLAHLLRVPSIMFAVNKLDAVLDPALAFGRIEAALQRFCEAAGLHARAVVPISALQGQNVVEAAPGWCGYRGPSLLQLPGIAAGHGRGDGRSLRPARPVGRKSPGGRRHEPGPAGVLGPCRHRHGPARADRAGDAVRPVRNRGAGPGPGAAPLRGRRRTQRWPRPGPRN